MSRPYRIQVTQSLRRVVRAEDSVTSTIEILPILDKDELADLLAEQLARKGFRATTEGCVRESGGVKIQIDPKTGAVRVTVATEKELNLRTSESVTSHQPMLAPEQKKRAKRKLESQLESKADKHQSELESKITDRMERVLEEIQPELDQVVNRTTAQALKIKAARLGQIKEISENEQDGSMTIVVEI